MAFQSPRQGGIIEEKRLMFFFPIRGSLFLLRLFPGHINGPKIEGNAAAQGRPHARRQTPCFFDDQRGLVERKTALLITMPRLAFKSDTRLRPPGVIDSADAGLIMTAGLLELILPFRYTRATGFPVKSFSSAASGTLAKIVPSQHNPQLQQNA
jgi:hypothetical protein